MLIHRKLTRLLLNRPFVLAVAVWLCSGIGFGHRPVAADELKMTRDNQTISINGELVVQAQDGSLLFRGQDGVLWYLDSDEYDEVVDNDTSVAPLTHAELGQQLQDELPTGFEVHQTDHYVIVHNTSASYAKWVGILCERLYRGFHNYWKTKRFPLHEPEFPLPIIIFKSTQNYQRYAVSDLGQQTSMVAYYNLLSNRVAMYDLTGLQELQGVRDLSNSDQINTILSQPAAFSLVATIVHEATHQIMFNCGMQQRLADTPLWVNEGLAVYFETPDLSSRSGWRGMGKINQPRLMQYRRWRSTQLESTLPSLISDDKRFRDADQAANAYAEAWALNYFLLRREKKDYVRYLQTLAEKRPAEVDTPQQRLAEFEQHFGDIQQIEKELIEFIRNLR